MIHLCFFALSTLSGAVLADEANAKAQTKSTDTNAVSYHKQIWPIVQRRCIGCHQPARKGGGLSLTSYAVLVQGGKGGSAVEAGKPDESLLIASLLGDGMAKMPKGEDPLTSEQIALFKKWIAEGAKDDTPAAQRDEISPEHPPSYDAPPIISALAFSRDGKYLAVGGYREILLHRLDAGGPVRLVGLSQRITSLAFSPDNNWLAATGGSPGRFGELQLWRLSAPETKQPVKPTVEPVISPKIAAIVGGQKATATAKPLQKPATAASATPSPMNEKPTLFWSSIVGPDTIFGASWSSDGSRIAMGGPDNNVRIVLAKDGKQILRYEHHTDWVIGTCFSTDDKHLVSVSRDRAVKLTQTETGSFIDNITSITPGALTGGLEALDRHPRENSVAVGGVDGVPKLYQIFRTKARQIGDDYNLLRAFDKLPGKISALRFSSDGQWLAVAATSEAAVFAVADGKKLARIPFPRGVYAVALHPTNGTFAAGGYDGVVRIADVKTGKIVREFIPVPISAKTAKR